MNNSEHIIDTALETYPLVDLPPNFVHKTMVQIKPAPRFHLTFTDYALPAFFSFFGAIVQVVVFCMINSLNHTWILDIQAKFLQLSHYTSTLPLDALIVTGVVGLIFFATVVLAFSLWLEKPIRLLRRIS